MAKLFVLLLIVAAIALAIVYREQILAKLAHHGVTLPVAKAEGLANQSAAPVPETIQLKTSEHACPEPVDKAPMAAKAFLPEKAPAGPWASEAFDISGGEDEWVKAMSQASQMQVQTNGGTKLANKQIRADPVVGSATVPLLMSDLTYDAKKLDYSDLA